MARDIGYGDYACYYKDEYKDIAEEFNVTVEDCDTFSDSKLR